MSTAVTKPVTALPAVADMQKDQNIGRETMGMKDYALPFLLILQSLSPQVVKASPKRVDGAEEGDFYNTVTEELYTGKEGVIMVPCAYQRLNVEWMPRDSGGGFVAQHASDDILAKCTRDERGFDRLGNGNLVVTTAYYYGMLVDEEEKSWEPIVLSLARTQLKKARRWNSMMSTLAIDDAHGASFNPPMFSHKYRLTTEPEHKKDYNWFGIHVENIGMIKNGDLYLAARKLAIDVSKGAVKTQAPGAETAGEDNIPF